MAVIFEALYDDTGTQFGFDTDIDTVRSRLREIFPTVEKLGGEEDLSIVPDSDIPMLYNLRGRYRSNLRNVKSFQTVFPGEADCWLSYDIMFEDTHPQFNPDNRTFGFDFGNEVRNGGQANEPRVTATIMKMPGLANDLVNNSGGLQTDVGFSARMYILGHADDINSPGNARRNAAVWGVYSYANERDGQRPIPTRFTNYMPGDHTTVPGGYNQAGAPGRSDPDNTEAVPGIWQRIVVRVVHNQTNFNNSSITTWVNGQPAFFKDGYRFTNDPSDPDQQTTEFAYSTFHGGDASQMFQPGFESYMRIRNVRVATTEQEAFALFPSDNPTPFEIATPEDGATGVVSPVTIAGSVPSDGRNDVVQVEVEDDGGLTISAFSETEVVVDEANGEWSASGVVIPQDNGVLTARARRWGVG